MAESLAEPAKLLLLAALLTNDKIISNNGKSFLKDLILRRDARLGPLLKKFEAKNSGDNSFLEELHNIIMDEAQSMYNELFFDTSLEVGKTLSKTERDAKSLGQEKSLIYGEVEFNSFYRVLRKINPRAGLIFYDLGSGTGKAVFAARFAYDFSKCIGIEILSSLHEQAVKVLNRYNTDFRSNLALGVNQQAAVYEGSILDFDWSDGDVIFANSTCFDDELMNSLSDLADNLKPGAIVVTFTKGLNNNSNTFELLERKRYRMSWGPATVFIHRRLQADGSRVEDAQPLNLLPSDAITYEESASNTSISSDDDDAGDSDGNSSSDDNEEEEDEEEEEDDDQDYEDDIDMYIRKCSDEEEEEEENQGSDEEGSGSEEGSEEGSGSEEGNDGDEGSSDNDEEEDYDDNDDEGNEEEDREDASDDDTAAAYHNTPTKNGSYSSSNNSTISSYSTGSGSTAGSTSKSSSIVLSSSPTRNMNTSSTTNNNNHNSSGSSRGPSSGNPFATTTTTTNNNNTYMSPSKSTASTTTTTRSPTHYNQSTTTSSGSTKLSNSVSFGSPVSSGENSSLYANSSRLSMSAELMMNTTRNDNNNSSSNNNNEEEDENNHDSVNSRGSNGHNSANLSTAMDSPASAMHSPMDSALLMRKRAAASRRAAPAAAVPTAPLSPV